MDTATCDHKFVGPKHCAKCGWEPTREEWLLKKPVAATATPAPARYIGRDPHTNGPACAIVPDRIRPDELLQVYKKLPPEARQHVTMAKRWKVWGVLCTDAWAVDNSHLKEAP